ncbi:hypothetical protein FHG87_017048 [Trinorchestia longiramus]|nr:hypothetical protein FHG87_017048 [Trinorchestia longiramus]
MEKIVNIRLTRWLEADKLVNSVQFGFHQNRGTIDALVRLQNYLVANLDERRQTLCVFFDLHKAYYTAWSVSFMLYSSFAHLPALSHRMQVAINNVNNWATEHGFVFSPEKIVGLHFQRRNRCNPPRLVLQGRIVNFVRSAEFLEMIVDDKLSWTPHLNFLKLEFTRRMNILKCLSGLSSGADRATMLRLYRTLIRSKLNYGCVVYQHVRETNLAKLDPVHHAALRLCTSAFRASPVVSLCVEGGEPPLWARRLLLSLQYLTRLEQLPLSSTWMSVHASRILPANVMRGLFLEHVADKYAASVKIYTDGSKSGGAVGCSVVLGEVVRAGRFLLGTSVFTSELYGVIEALQLIEEHPNRYFTVFTDSKNIIDAIQVYASSHPIIGHVKFLVDPEEIERHSTINVVCVDDKNYQAHIGFLQLNHRYQVKFPLRLQSSAANFKALLQPSLAVKSFEVEVSSQCEEELLVTLELLAYKTKLLREKLVLVRADQSDRITITFSARVLGPGQGTPSLLNGVKQISVELVGDSEVSDWQGFD